MTDRLSSTLKMKKLLTIVVITFLSNLMMGEKNPDDSFKTNTSKTDKIFQFTWANDFPFHTDYYFTNGVQFSYFSPVFKYSPLNFILLPSSNIGKVYYGLSFTQRIFTPADLNYTNINSNDRPFSSYLLLGSNKISLNPKSRYKLSSAFSIGLIGKPSGGQYFQNSIHDILPTSPHVSGWKNQIGNDIALSYYAEFEKGIFQFSGFELNGSVFSQIGVPHSEMGINSYIRIGRFEDYFANLGLNRKINWQAFLFAGISGKTVLYNATLEGGLFNESQQFTQDAIKPFVVDFVSGFSVVHRNFKIELGQHSLTPEFNGGLSHRWAYLSVHVGL